MRSLAVVLLLVACGDNADTPRDAATPSDTPKPVDAAADAAAPVDAGPRGPATFAITGTAYGAVWDDAADTLYIANQTNNRVDRWTDANGIQTHGTLSGTGNTLGALLKLADGTFLVPSLGSGMGMTAVPGTIRTLSADGATSNEITGLNGARRRVGIALAPDGTLYEAFYTGGGMMSPTGGVATVAITNGAGVENDIATSGGTLGRLTGIAATATTLYVCNQPAVATSGSHKVDAITLATGAVTPLATVPSCDQIIILPNGDLATGGITGGVYRITQAGAVSSIRSGFEFVRGLAYDATLKRMFVVEHRATVPTQARLHVFPLDG